MARRTAKPKKRGETVIVVDSHRYIAVPVEVHSDYSSGRERAFYEKVAVADDQWLVLDGGRHPILVLDFWDRGEWTTRAVRDPRSRELAFMLHSGSSPDEAIRKGVKSHLALMRHRAHMRPNPRLLQVR